MIDFEQHEIEGTAEISAIIICKIPQIHGVLLEFMDGRMMLFEDPAPVSTCCGKTEQIPAPGRWCRDPVWRRRRPLAIERHVAALDRSVVVESVHGTTEIVMSLDCCHGRDVRHALVPYVELT
nr:MULTISPECIES: hypothetical protein [Rhizobium]